jgi:hypothetical protein
LDDVIRRLLIKENKESLEKSGFSILRDIEMDSSLSFDIDNCYVCTVDKDSIKECLIYYELINEKMKRGHEYKTAVITFSKHPDFYLNKREENNIRNNWRYCCL